MELYGEDRERTSGEISSPSCSTVALQLAVLLEMAAPTDDQSHGGFERAFIFILSRMWLHNDGRGSGRNIVAPRGVGHIQR